MHHYTSAPLHFRVRLCGFYFIYLRAIVTSHFDFRYRNDVINVQNIIHVYTLEALYAPIGGFSYTADSLPELQQYPHD